MNGTTHATCPLDQGSVGRMHCVSLFLSGTNAALCHLMRCDDRKCVHWSGSKLPFHDSFLWMNSCLPSKCGPEMNVVGCGTFWGRLVSDKPTVDGPDADLERTV